MNEGSPSPATSAALARNLTTARNERGMTLGGLAESSGVADSILSGIEWGKQTPTIELVSRLANALGVSFGCLLQSTEHPVAVSENGVQVTLIDRQDTPRIIETYLMDLCPSATRYAGGHPDGVEEHITVLSGVLTAGPRESPSRLIPGQSLRFRADGPHIYRSGSNAVRASVTVIYPEHKHDAPTVFDVSLPWPDNGEDWRIVVKLLERAHIEVQNGVDMRRILFTGCPLDQDDAIENLEQYVLEHRRKKGSLALQVHVLQHPLPGLCVLWRGKRLSPLDKDSSHTAWDTAYRLAQMAADNTTSPHLDPITRAELMQIAGTGPTLHAALAAEAMTLHDLPSTPCGISCKDPAIRSRPRTGRGILFEDRIDVDAYEAYELVHPAYARQVLALAGALRAAGVSPRARLLDIGTGPGLPLEMLLQLIPDLQVTALDPSETAFRHLQKRFSGHSGVTMLQCGIDSFENTGPVFDAAISVGASHHLDTALFFRATADTLAEGASFVVSDEMIAPFRTVEERQLNLVAHHLYYIADTLVPIPYALLSPEEGEVVRAFRRHVPVCLSLATARLSGALSYVRDLFRIVDKIALPEPVSHPLMAFYRFHILELQALVAGLDYEVEQKTYAQRLVALADAEGLSCVHHQRLYKTQGNGEWDAGTHLFTFRKQ
ncbi:helix-turn-helix domain-containing protein [Haematospirillum sp. 15-248]|uniref:helix-turn-helix domain-containing protein n=1 Tax=Haematospirillum sp. 15-248 TaxID=2723107 RepID=UPI00143A938A|nr:helix-turn-helix domain-containing protein [Haematospirillum sp. 15-248]NKD88640.1 helix-turn-helix domain-containing protein [Haematospirillum sp. 15-248]